MAPPIDWMPPLLDDARKAEIAAEVSDPHMAAAVAWEEWAATLDVEGAVTSVSTGAQTITYAKGHSPWQAAMDRASWHRSRSSIKSVAFGGRYVWGWDRTEERDQSTYDSEPMPLTGMAQINLPTGRVGPPD